MMKFLIITLIDKLFEKFFIKNIFERLCFKKSNFIICDVKITFIMDIK